MQKVSGFQKEYTVETQFQHCFIGFQIHTSSVCTCRGVEPFIIMFLLKSICFTHIIFTYMLIFCQEKVAKHKSIIWDSRLYLHFT